MHNLQGTIIQNTSYNYDPKVVIFNYDFFD